MPVFAVDVRALTDAVRVLCSPLVHDSPAAWRAAAQQAVSRVIGDDLAPFVFPDFGHRPGVAMARPTSGSAPIDAAVRADLYEQRDVLDALLSAYHAGMTTVLQLDRARAALLHQLEATATSAVLFDADGEEVMRTAPVTDILSGQAPSVLEAMQQVARRVGALARRRATDAATAERDPSPSTPGRAAAFPGPVTARVGARSFLLTPTVHPDLLVWRGAAVVVVVQGERRSATEASLRERHGLTPREVDVARALATGAAVADIATTLGVTVHTVRRHSEQVYRKLGVNTRLQLTERLKGPAEQTRRRDRCA